MKKKKLRAKLDKTRQKLAAARTELDAMLSIMAASGMPRAEVKPATAKDRAAKASKPGPKPAAKRPAPSRATRKS